MTGLPNNSFTGRGGDHAKRPANPGDDDMRRAPLHSRCRFPCAGCLLAAALLAPTSLRAADVSGSANVAFGATDVDGLETELVDQQYAFSLFQRLTPYLSLRLGASALELETRLDALELNRRSREPRLELLYNRERLSAALVALDRTTEGTLAADEFEVESYLGYLTWRTEWGPVFSFQARQESNVADVAFFGRDNESRTLSGSVLWNRSFWSAGYTVESFELDNRLSGIELDQVRQDVRFDAGRGFLDDELFLSLDTRVSRLDREERVAPGADVAEPVPARQGLFAVDTSPASGTLALAPGVVDGDVTAPAAPDAEIGGANTFRNFGVDLGLTLPVSRLEVTVNAPTDPGLVWEVWRSADNLLWDRVPGVVAELDSVLLRYTLRFPETTDRFFKAVNVTPNAAVDVQVSELRALRDVDSTVSPDGESNLYRADLTAVYRPTERFTWRVNAGGSEDENLSGPFVRRRFEEVHAGSRFELGLVRDLRLRAGYLYQDFETDGGTEDPAILRTEHVYDAGLVWTPLPTVEAYLSVNFRDELEEDRDVRSLRTTRLHLVTELLPDLLLTTQLEESMLEDFLSGFERQGWSIRQLLDSRPTARWDVSGGWSLVYYEDDAGTALIDRLALDLQSTWVATPYLTLIGAWEWSVDDAPAASGREFLRQSYSAAWSPGPKLTLAGTWESFDDEDLRQTTNTSVSASYRLTARFTLFGSLTRSSFEETGEATSETTSFRTGFSFFF